MDKSIAQTIGLKKAPMTDSVRRSIFSYSEQLMKEGLVISLKTRLLALAIFLYFFIENGTLGLFPEKWYIIYRNVRLSDFVLYALIIYSVVCIKEYRELFKSKSLFVTKLVLFWLLFEFGLSALRYDFNVLEYFFRLKGIWASFLILPYMLLLQRNGLPFLIKVILPVAVVSNVLYILTAVTGIPFLPDVSIQKQLLPGGIEVFRVYGGTFFGDIFYLAFFYFWITKKFRFYQLILAILFIIPHVLAFGRTAWAFFIFTILLMVVFNSLQKRAFKIFVRHAVILGLLLICFVIAFIKFIPESDYYVDALNARIFEGQEDVRYNEGTYGTRTVFQNNSLVKLWLSSNLIIGIGMHPMWVVRAESYEEQLYYNAFSDVSWAGVLAAYGLIGFSLAALFQVYYIRTTFRLIRKYKYTDLFSFTLWLFLSKLLFDSFITFSFALVSVGLWGLYWQVNFYTANVVYLYEKLRKENPDSSQAVTSNGLAALKRSKFHLSRTGNGVRAGGLFKKNTVRK